LFTQGPKVPTKGHNFFIAAILCFMTINKYLRIFVAGILLSVFSPSWAGVCAAEELKVGALLNLTGHGARWGENARRGIESARDNLSDSGLNVRVIFEDTRSGDPKVSAAAAQKLLNVDRVDVLLTQWATETEIVYPMAVKRSVPVITVSSGAPGLTEGRPLLFSTWGDDNTYLEEIISHMEDKGLSSPAVLVVQDPYFVSLGNRMLELFQSRGIKPVLIRNLQPHTSRLDTEALHIRATGADAVVCLIYLSQQADLVRHLAALNTTPTVYGVIGSDEEAFFKLAGQAARGVLVPTYPVVSKAFLREFKKRWNEAPWLSADTAYDALMIAAHAAGNTESTQKDLGAALRTMEGFTGASGSISFSDNGVRSKRRASLIELDFKD